MTLEKLKCSKKYDCDTSVDLSEDSQSLIMETTKYQKSKERNKKMNRIDILNVKHIPTLFFIIFIIVLGMLTAKFLPYMINIKAPSELYKHKETMKYLPEIIGEQPTFVKVSFYSIRHFS